MEKKPCLVLGEASESEEEDVVISTVGCRPQNAVAGIVVAGEATESDDTETEEDSFSSASEAFMSRSSEALRAASRPPSSPKTKYRSLLHKKLCDRNASLQTELQNFLRRPLVNAGRKLNEVNQQLLASQVEIQEAATAMQHAYTSLVRLSRAFDNALAVPFLPKIQMPTSTDTD